MRKKLFSMILVVMAFVLAGSAVVMAGATTAPSVEWIRPSGGANGEPLWGVQGGMLVGLAPLPGPRGLIRVYTPYLGQPARKMMNFIAVEPVVDGVRCLSELDRSGIDGKQGLMMWTEDAVDLNATPAFAAAPARGVVGHDGDAETLTVYLCVERYRNGACPVIRIEFRSDRPHEVSLSTFSAAGGRPMEACVLTATMGNWARLRHLQLRDRTVEAADLFMGAETNSSGFYDWHSWRADQLRVRDGEIVVTATGDLEAETPKDVPKAWRYVGQPAVQTWSTDAKPGVMARVNGRDTFWATKVGVPGGAAFENFEIYSPFYEGQAFRFGVDEVLGQR